MFCSFNGSSKIMRTEYTPLHWFILFKESTLSEHNLRSFANAKTSSLIYVNVNTINYEILRKIICFLNYRKNKIKLKREDWLFFI